jgi:hypothetical protein
MEKCCPICRAPVPVSLGPGRPRVYCSPRCRRQAERLARADRDWAELDPAVKAMVGHLEVPVLDVDEANRAMSRGR